MRGSRILCTLVLIASAAAFGLFNWNYYRSKDTLGPVISMDSSDIFVSVNDPQSQVMAGVTAMDSKDGDVTNLMLIEDLSDFVEEDTRIVSYAAFDKDNHVSKAQRRMTDYCSALQEKAFMDAKVMLNEVRWAMSANSNTMKMGMNPETHEIYKTERVLDPIRVELDVSPYGGLAE